MNERVAALMAAVEENEELRQALQGATSVEQTVQIAAAHGVSVTVEELEAAAADGDASDAELEGSAAGLTAIGFTCGCQFTSAARSCA